VFVNVTWSRRTKALADRAVKSACLMSQRKAATDEVERLTRELSDHKTQLEDKDSEAKMLAQQLVAVSRTHFISQRYCVLCSAVLLQWCNQSEYADLCSPHLRSCNWSCKKPSHLNLLLKLHASSAKSTLP